MGRIITSGGSRPDVGGMTCRSQASCEVSIRRKPLQATRELDGRFGAFKDVDLDEQGRQVMQAR